MKHQKTIEQEVINFIERHQLLRGAKNILIGLSGGADSVFALYFFFKFAKKYKIKISAVHVNHNLREKESVRDEKFCTKLCSELGIEFNKFSVNVRSFSKEKKKSIEEAARILRYEKFREVCEQTKSDLIVTAHNNDDNTETVLLNIVNGSGIDGLSGIPVRRDYIIRPFLCLSKIDIENYLKNEKIKFVKDSSNDNIDFNRNYLRKKIIPNLKKNLNPSLDKVVLNSSEVLRNQKKVIDFLGGKAYKDAVKNKNGVINLNIKKLSEYPTELLGDVLKNIFILNFNTDFNFKQFLKVKNLLNTNVGTKINIKGKIWAYRERNEIVFFQEENTTENLIEIGLNEEKKNNGATISIRPLENIPTEFTINRNKEIISGDIITGKFILRTWQEGDRIQLLGMKGTKKISDVLTDLKVRTSEKKKQLVLVNQKDIVWLVGLKISDKFKINSTTKSAVELCLK